MYRHRRHFSLDSYGKPAPPTVRVQYTLQGSPNAVGPRTARYQQHTSPLAIMQSITPPSPVSSESGSIDAVESEDEQTDAEIAEEMERMVSSVVNSPTESLSPVSATSSLGLGLPSPVAERRARMAPVTMSRSILAMVDNNAKQNMGMRAAVGNYRKRFMTGPVGSTPSVMSTDSDSGSSSNMPMTAQPALGGKAMPISHIPPTQDTPSSNPAPDSELIPARMGHRRSVSAGSMPSLDQIAEWSQRRQQAQPTSPVSPIVETMQNTLAAGFNIPKSSIVLVAPTLSINTTLNQHSLPSDGSSPSPSKIHIVSPPIVVSPALSPTKPRAQLVSPTLQDEKRAQRARQMVNVLRGRRSMSMSNAGITA